MEKRKGINNDDLKKRNRGLLLQLIAVEEANTRMMLTRKSGLSKMSVTNIIDEFLGKKLVIEGKKEYQEIQGRNPATLEISPKAPRIIGLLINREYCAAVLCDFQLHVEKKAVIDLTREELAQDAKATLLAYIFKLIEEMPVGRENILGIGVASIGPLDVEKGMILNPPRFYGIKNVPVKDILQERYGLPVFLDHQYNSAAKAEKLFGHGKHFPSFVFVGITNGIGAGIYVDGKMLRSVGGLGSELGHMSIDYHGIPCECGNRGCVENYASVNVICEKAEAVLGRKVDFSECCALYQDTEVDRILSDAVEKLCVCLVSVVNLINPEVIFLGHEGTELPDCYIERMERVINERKLSMGYGQVKVMKASFGEEQQLIGAACNVLDKVFSGKILL